jgi:hypothetical protein
LNEGNGGKFFLPSLLSPLVSKATIIPHLILGSGLSSGDGSICNKSGEEGDIILVLLARAR